MSTNYYNLESIESQSYFSHTNLRKLLNISEDKLNNVLTYLHIPFVILKNKNNGVSSKQISKSDYLKIKIFLNETDTNKLFTSITYKNKGITINSLAKELNCDCSKIKTSIRYLKLNIKKYILQ